jgi:hypothetical protein
MASAGSSAMEVLSATVVDRLRRRLVGEHSGRFRVEACIHYGAVDSDPKYLVVWLLLAGAPDDELPEWLNPGWRSCGGLSELSSRRRPGRMRAR